MHIIAQQTHDNDLVTSETQKTTNKQTQKKTENQFNHPNKNP